MTRVAGLPGGESEDGQNVPSPGLRGGLGRVRLRLNRVLAESVLPTDTNGDDNGRALLTRRRDNRRWEPPGGDDMPTADTEGEVEQLAMYAGQSVGLAASVEHAGVLVRRIAAEADAILANLASEGPG